MLFPARIYVLLLIAGVSCSAADLPISGPRLAPQAAASRTEFHEEEALSKLRAMELFPDIEKEASPLRRRMDEEMLRLVKEEPNAFDKPDWPVTIARYCAGCLGLKARSIADILQHAPDKSALAWEKDPHFGDLVIRSATYSVGKVELDVTRRLQAGVVNGTLTVECDDSLLPNPVNAAETTREVGETGEEFWKRHRAAMKAVTLNGPQATRTLLVSYERRGEIHTLSATQGAVLRIEASDPPPEIQIANDQKTGTGHGPFVHKR